MKLLKLVPDDTNIKFLKWRIPFFAVSLLLIAASWALVLTKGINKVIAGLSKYLPAPLARAIVSSKSKDFRDAD